MVDFKNNGGWVGKYITWWETNVERIKLIVESALNNMVEREVTIHVHNMIDLKITINKIKVEYCEDNGLCDWERYGIMKLEGRVVEYNVKLYFV